MSLSHFNISQDNSFSEALSAAAILLFSKKSRGHMGAFEYLDPMFEGDPLDGVKIWLDFLNQSQEYYVLNDEIKIIQQYAPEISQKLSGVATVIELGPGTDFAIQNKTVPFLKLLGETKGYIAVDISQEHLDNAESSIQKSLPHIRLRKYKADFYKGAITYRSSDIPLMVMFGLTLFNQESAENRGKLLNVIKEKLVSLRRQINQGYLVTTFDSNQDKGSIERAYAGQTALAINMLKRLQRDCLTNIDPEKFLFDVHWNQETSTLEHIFIAKEAQKFFINNESFTIRVGDRFCFNNSIKLSLEDNIKIANEAGFDVVSIYEEKNNPIKLCVLKTAS